MRSYETDGATSSSGESPAVRIPNFRPSWSGLKHQDDWGEVTLEDGAKAEKTGRRRLPDTWTWNP